VKKETEDRINVVEKSNGPYPDQRNHDEQKNDQNQVRKKPRFISSTETEFLLQFSPSPTQRFFSSSFFPFWGQFDLISLMSRRERKPPVLYSPTPSTTTPKVRNDFHLSNFLFSYNHFMNRNFGPQQQRKLGIETHFTSHDLRLD
jgi:hypothetical protein